MEEKKYVVTIGTQGIEQLDQYNLGLILVEELRKREDFDKIVKIEVEPLTIKG